MEELRITIILNYDNDNTGHVFEGTLSFNGTEKIPFSYCSQQILLEQMPKQLMVSCSIRHISKLDIQQMLGETSLDLFLGGTPTNPDKDKGETGFYGPKAGIINIGHYRQ